MLGEAGHATLAWMLTRRTFLGAVLVAPACAGTAGSPSRAGSDAAAPNPAPTADPGPAPGPAPTAACEETASDALGPYYTPGAPQRTTLVEPGMAGTRLTITGRVLSSGASCAALAGAEIDVWQANDAGVYDNAGFTLRGKFIADAAGSYRIETVLPGRYLDGARYRPRHVHVIVRAQGRAELTTQLYFAGDPYNATDALFQESLAMSPVDDGAGGQTSSFDFVLG
jgi:protocatechuate 3,4-dioxygenase beta subunit